MPCGAYSMPKAVGSSIALHGRHTASSGVVGHSARAVRSVPTVAIAAGLAAIATVGTERTARAECPTTPDDAVCRPWSAMLLPTAFGMLYAPHGMDSFYGGGL